MENKQHRTMIHEKRETRWWPRLAIQDVMWVEETQTENSSTAELRRQTDQRGRVLKMECAEQNNTEKEASQESSNV